jgi:hypothetical protein
MFVLSTALLVVALVTGAMAENTSPDLEVTTPTEGSSLGLQVVVSGTATDAEGFNMSSYVEARWNDWEWFVLPSTPADGGSALYFGEVVNLQWHTPGPHRLFVRAYDGQLHSPTVEVNLTVRDLPDLVVMPTDISREPGDATAGEMADLVVVVRNQGGEGVGEIEVTFKVNGEDAGVVTIGAIEAYGSARATLEVELEAGNLTVRASAYAVDPIEEKSLQNNEAENTLVIEEGEEGPGLDDLVPILVVVIGVVVFLAAMLLYVMAVGSQKD